MSIIRGKRLLILGSSRLSCEIVREARKMGAYVIVTDWYSIEKAPAKQIANKSYDVSITDMDAMEKLIYDERIDGILTGFTDSTLPYYAEICSRVNLPCYGTLEQFDLLINKNKYKKLCKLFNVPVVEEYYINKDSDDSNYECIKYPVLVKPADNSGARGITICNNKEELKEAHNHAMKFSQSKEIIVERYIDGKEVTIFWLFNDGEIMCTSLGNRHIKHNQEGTIALPVAYTFPSIFINKYQEELINNATNMFRSIGIKNGMLFMQCLVENDKCIIYDMGYRLTGSLEYILLKDLCGYNPLEMMIHFALSGKMYDQRPSINPLHSRYGFNITFLVRPGIIGKIDGLEKVRSINGVLDVVEAHVEGDKIPLSSKGTLFQVILRVFGTANTKDELVRIMNEVHSVFKVYDSNGNNMLLEVLNTNEVKEVVI